MRSSKKKQKTGDKAEKGSSSKFQVNKLNPMLYQEDKRTKRLVREEDHAKHKLNKSNYIRML
jgi:hypothetical protein